MNKDVLKFIDQIINKVTKADISALEVEVDGIKVRAERNVTVNAPVSTDIAAGLSVLNEQSGEEIISNINSKTKSEIGKVIKSPIVGTFYSSPSPNDEPFVSTGKRIAKGQSVCIIEAMKIMNEIESEFDGIVKEILVSDGDLIEYGQPLIIIE